MESFKIRGPKKFVITGHSLGGALASICAVDVVVEQLLRGEDVILYSYGALRNGDQAFATLVDNYVDHFRVVHGEDIVPHLLKFWYWFIYRHSGTEIWCNAPNEATVWDEKM